MCSVPYNRNDLSYICQIDKFVLPLIQIQTPILFSGIYQISALKLPIGDTNSVTKWAKACIDCKWPLLKKYIWNKNEDLFCKTDLLFSLCVDAPACLRSECLWAGLEAVFFVVCLPSTGKPMLLSFSFFSSSPAFEHRTPILPPPKRHIPAPWFHGTRRISPAMPSGCLLTLAGGTDGNINSPPKSKTLSVYF